MASIISTNSCYTSIRECIDKLPMECNTYHQVQHRNVVPWREAKTHYGFKWANSFMNANCELNCIFKTIIATTFFHNLCPFPWTKRQPNRAERPRFWSLVLGAPLLCQMTFSKSFIQLVMVSLSVKWGHIFPDQRKLYENTPQTVKSHSHTVLFIVGDVCIWSACFTQNPFL